VETRPEDFGHCLSRSVMLPQRKAVFVPMPKAGCTSILWMLAEIAGIGSLKVHQSLTPQVTQSMTIHDITLWPDKLRWSSLSDADRERIANDDEWLRFTIVRDPARRLFSAWQSKLLMREPMYLRRYGAASWFPRVPTSASDIVEDFRAFVLSLADPDDTFPVDVHWARQHDVLADAPHLNHIGRVENLDATLRRMRGQLGNVVLKARRRHENRTLLDYTPGLYDAETAAVVNDYFAADLTAFGYPEVPGDEVARLGTWRVDVKPVLPAIAELVERHERLGELVDRAQRLRRRTWELEHERRDLREQLVRYYEPSEADRGETEVETR
jgi:hypothetical protein